MLEVRTEGVEQSAEALNRLAENANNASNAADNAGQRTATLDDLFQQFSLSSLAAAGGVAELVNALKGFVSGVTNFAGQALQAEASFDALRGGLQGLLQNMGEGADMGDKLFESLRRFSLQTSFGVDTLAAAAQQMLTTGVATKDLNDKIKQLGNIAGGSTEKFNRLVEIYTKIKASGKAGAQQIQQLSMLTGVSFVNALGKTNASAQELDELFEKMASDGGVFANAMDGINNTLGGKMEFVTSTWTEFLAGFANLTGLLDMAKGALDIVYNALQAIVDVMNGWSENPVIKAVFSGVVAGILTGIAAALGTGIVLALKGVIAHLITATAVGQAFMAALPIVGVVSAVAAAVVGLGVATAKLIKVQNERKKEEYEAETQQYRDRIDVLKDLSDAEVMEMKESLKRQQEDVQNGMLGAEWGFDEEIKRFSIEYYEAMKKIGKEQKKIREQLWDFDSQWETSQSMPWDEWVESMGGVESQTVQIISKYRELENEMARVDSEYRKATDGVKKFTESISLQNALLASRARAGDVYEGTRSMITEYIAANSGNARQRLNAELAALEEEYHKAYNERTRTVEVNGVNMTALTGMDWENSDEYNEFLKYKQLRLAELNNSSGGGSVAKQASDIEVWNSIWGTNVAMQYKKDERGNFVISGGYKVQDWEGIAKATFDMLDAELSNTLSFLDKRDGSDANTQNNLELLDGLIDKFNKSIEALGTATDSSGNHRFTVGGKWISPYQEKLDELKQDRYDLTISQYTLPEETSAAIQEMFNQLRYTITGVDGVELMRNILDYSARDSAEGELDTFISDLQRMFEFTTGFAADTKESKNMVLEELNKRLTELTNSLNVITDDDYFNEEDTATLEAVANLRLQVDITTDAINALGSTIKEEENAVQELKMSLSDWSQRMLAQGNEAARKGKLLSADGKTELANYSEASFMTRMFDTFNMTLAGGLLEILENTDYGKFIDSIMGGANPLLALLQVIATDIAEVVGGIDGIQVILNPVKEAIKEFEPLFKSLLMLLYPIGALLKIAAQWLMNFLDSVTGNLFSEMSDMYDELVLGNKKEDDSTKELINQLKALKDAIQEQEEYYLEKKRDLNASTAIGITPVNDMILTDRGIFSTDPKDTIMAMKDPSSLMRGGGSVVNVHIENQMGSSADVSVQKTQDKDGVTELTIMISKKVAGDFAAGKNGWDAAYDAQQSRRNGRRVSL